MKWRALATDFDSTVATDGVVPLPTVQALIHAREGGLTLILMTGRDLRDFDTLGFELKWFDRVVAENGAVLFDPQSGGQTLLAPPPAEQLVEELGRRGVKPLSIGRTIVSTTEPNEADVLDAIKKLGLELVVTFNKGSVLVLPPGINKASGLAAAMGQMHIPMTRVVGVGDGENDHSFLDECGLSVAVANALPALQERAHVVTQKSSGEGVAELIGRLLDGELEALP